LEEAFKSFHAAPFAAVGQRCGRHDEDVGMNRGGDRTEVFAAGRDVALLGCVELLECS
jgi:hypothetical protein